MNAKARLQILICAFLAGVMIALGGTAFLACDNRYVGALLFSVGLFAVCTRGLYLYTGKAGYLLQNPRFYIEALVLIWVGNFAGVAVIALGVAHTHPALAEKAAQLCTAKLTQSAPATLFLGAMCGLLLFIAVDHYKNSADGMQKYLGILLGVPAFILCGFEHVIADMFYFSVSGVLFSAFWRTAGFLVLATVGNTAGALLFPALKRFTAPL